MGKELVYNLLIHPFYTILSGNPQAWQVSDARFITGIWKNHILEVARHEDRGLFIISSAPNRKSVPYSMAGLRLLSELEEFAKEKLGERCLIINDYGNQDLEAFIRKNIKAKKRSKGLAMGEYYEVCVKHHSELFARITAQSIRRSKARSIASSRGGRMRKGISTRDHYTAVVNRAKKIAEIRAARLRR